MDAVCIGGGRVGDWGSAGHVLHISFVDDAFDVTSKLDGQLFPVGLYGARLAGRSVHMLCCICRCSGRIQVSFT